MRYIAKLSILTILMLGFSCNKDDNPEPLVSSDLSLLKSENKVLRNQEIIFQLMDEETDITQSATFYVNDTAIDGNIFSSSVEGVFQVYAEYSGTGRLEKTQMESFEVYIPRKKLLIEGFTGTWCGNCPILDFHVDKARDSIEDLVVVWLHGGRAFPGSEDPFTVPETQILGDYFDIIGFPTSYVNRDFWWYNFESAPNPYLLEDLMPYVGLDTDVSMSIDSKLNDKNLSVDVHVISEKNISNSKLVVFLLEDKLLYDQLNYGNEYPDNPFYGMGNPIVDYEHKDVLRVSLTDVLGDVITETPALTEYNRSFNIDISSEFNPANLKLVVTVLDGDNLARNTQQAPINQFQDYE